LTRLARLQPDRKFVLIKNNVSTNNRTFGTHESYLTGRELEFDTIVRWLTPFMVTRILWAGAGRLVPTKGGGYGYEISQRARFISELSSYQTTESWPKALFNTRDEPLANPEKYRRLHMINGD